MYVCECIVCIWWACMDWTGFMSLTQWMQVYTTDPNISPHFPCSKGSNLHQVLNGSSWLPCYANRSLNDECWCYMWYFLWIGGLKSMREFFKYLKRKVWICHPNPINQALLLCSCQTMATKCVSFLKYTLIVITQWVLNPLLFDIILIRGISFYFRQRNLVDHMTNATSSCFWYGFFWHNAILSVDIWMDVVRRQI